MVGIVVASGSAVSVSANSKSADQVSGTYQYLPFDATLTVAARSSATGMNLQLFGAGQAILNDLNIPWTGTAGALTLKDHVIASVTVAAGTRPEFFLRNTTGGALTADFIVYAEPLE